MVRRMAVLFPVVIFAMMLIQGCFTLKTVTRERVDMEVSGNQGYLAGEPSSRAKGPKDKTRTYIKLEVELSEYQDIEESEEQIEATQEEEAEELDEGALDNAGVFDKGYFLSKKDEGASELSCAVTEEEYIEIEMIEELQEPSYTFYTVKKGETLWDIAARPEVYGKASKWKLIYDANKDIIKKPSMIRPGMKLRIPR